MGKEVALILAEDAAMQQKIVVQLARQSGIDGKNICVFTGIEGDIARIREKIHELEGQGKKVLLLSDNHMIDIKGVNLLRELSPLLPSDQVRMCTTSPDEVRAEVEAMGVALLSKTGINDVKVWLQLQTAAIAA